MFTVPNGIYHYLELSTHFSLVKIYEAQNVQFYNNQQYSQAVRQAREQNSAIPSVCVISTVRIACSTGKVLFALKFHFTNTGILAIRRMIHSVLTMRINLDSRETTQV